MKRFYFKFWEQEGTHYLALGLVLVLGAGLRFLQLDLKPLWLDEVITAIFSLGRSYGDVPTEALFSVPQLEQIFTFNPGVSCAAIAQRISIESVHPPLFFCLMYRWIAWLRPDSAHWIWALRSLPALFGILEIAAIYLLNRIAFSATAGLMAAVLMAVSPFAVYLSQEARHYTLPMLLITLALTALVMMQQDLPQNQRLRPSVWIGWAAINTIGLYVHYFFILALVAQVGALGGWMLAQRRSIPLHRWYALFLAIGGIGLSYLPWFSTLLSHFDRPETAWLKPAEPDWVDRIAPLYQTIIGWSLMVISLPVEGQPLWFAIPVALVALSFTGWLAWKMQCGLKHVWSDKPLRPSVVLLAGFTLCVLLQFCCIIYGLDKDITVVPRYNFVYYPGICALLAVSLAALPATGSKTSALTVAPSGGQAFSWRRVQAIVVLVGIVSSLFVVNGLSFHKSYYPEKVAHTMYAGASTPVIMTVSYRSLQEIALGLSFALELRKLYPEPLAAASVRFAFLHRPAGHNQVWRKIARLEQPLPLPLNLWVVGSAGTRSRDYPDQLTLPDPALPRNREQSNCAIDPDGYHRIGFPYQLYHCKG